MDKALNKDLYVVLDKIVALLFSIRAVTFVWLAFASNEYMPAYAWFVSAIRLSTPFVGVVYLLIKKDAGKADVLSLAPLVLYLTMLIVHTNGGYRGSYLHEFVSIACFMLMGKYQKARIFKYFYRIILACCVVSLVLYILSWLDAQIFEELPFYNDGVLSSHYYRWFIFAILGNHDYTLPRLCGIFNEPGALGTVCALLFAAVFPHSKMWEKLVLVATAICTFSVAGYLLIALYLVMSACVKDWRYSILIVFAVGFFLLAPSIDWGNEMINRFVDRFEITSTGLAGDNRTQPKFVSEYEAFKNSDSVLFGLGAGSAEGLGASSYQTYILQFGYMGFLFFFSVWLVTCLRAAAGSRECILLLIVFVVSLYQRPAPLINSYGYTLLFGAFAWMQMQNACPDEMLKSAFSLKLFGNRNSDAASIAKNGWKNGQAIIPGSLVCSNVHFAEMLSIAKSGDGSRFPQTIRRQLR